MELNLKNKNVLITGGLSGIGLETTKLFSEEGANVIVTSRNKKKIKDKTNYFKKKNKNILIIRADPSKSSDLKLLKSKIDKNNIKLDILINNIGNGTSEGLAIPKEKTWNRTWNTNFKIPLSITNLFLNDLTKSKGVIIFVASIVGLEVLEAPTDYSLAKNSIINLSKILSKKLIGKVRVNSVSPGNILFDGGTWEKKIKKNKKNVYEYIKTNVPLNRFGTAKEIANSIVFLSSDKASFINGSNLTVDGGQTSVLK